MKRKPKKDPAAVALGRKGGVTSRGNMTPEQRSEAARHASNVRYGKTKPSPQPGRWYGLVLIPEVPTPKPGDPDYHGNIAAQLKRLDQAHAEPDVLLWSLDRDEVMKRKKKEDRLGNWTEIIDVDYDPTKFTITRTFKPDVSRQLKALASLIDVEEAKA